MIKIEINVTDHVSQSLRNIISGLKGSEMAELNEVAGRAAVNAAIKYHRDYDKAGGWRGKRYLGSAKGEGGSFGSSVAAGWHFQSSDSAGAVIVNNADYYAFKVRGGTITPKRAQFLTIPLIREACGVPVKDYASVYQQNTGRKLFRPKGKSVLMEKTDDGKARSVYALVRSVTMRPWPNAIPDEGLIAAAFAKRWKAELGKLIDAS